MQGVCRLVFQHSHPLPWSLSVPLEPVLAKACPVPTARSPGPLIVFPLCLSVSERTPPRRRKDRGRRASEQAEQEGKQLGIYRRDPFLSHGVRPSLATWNALSIRCLRRYPWVLEPSDLTCVCSSVVFSHHFRPGRDLPDSAPPH